MPSGIQLELQRNLALYLQDKIKLNEFEDWFLPVLWTLGEQEDNEARQLAGTIGNLIAEASLGDRSDDSLRQELAKAIRPFAPRFERTPGSLVLKEPSSVEWRGTMESVRKPLAYETLEEPAWVSPPIRSWEQAAAQA